MTIYKAIEWHSELRLFFIALTIYSSFLDSTNVRSHTKQSSVQFPEGMTLLLFKKPLSIFSLLFSSTVYYRKKTIQSGLSNRTTAVLYFISDIQLLHNEYICVSVLLLLLYNYNLQINNTSLTSPLIQRNSQSVSFIIIAFVLISDH